MTIKSYTEQLEEIQAAITAILGGAQSYTVGQMTYERASLDTLLRMQERLMPLAVRETAGVVGIRVRGVIPCE